MWAAPQCTNNAVFGAPIAIYSTRWLLIRILRQRSHVHQNSKSHAMTQSKTTLPRHQACRRNLLIYMTRICLSKQSDPSSSPTSPISSNLNGKLCLAICWTTKSRTETAWFHIVTMKAQLLGLGSRPNVGNTRCGKKAEPGRERQTRRRWTRRGAHASKRLASFGRQTIPLKSPGSGDTKNWLHSKGNMEWVDMACPLCDLAPL